MTRKTKIATTTTKPDNIALPKGILASDLKYPAYKRDGSGPRVIETLEMHYVTTFGWCISTLHIRNAGRRHVHTTARTYAVRVHDGSLVRIGLGPHVLKSIRVYVTDKRAPALQHLLDLHAQGEVRANETRDRISTRRAQSASRRDPADVLARFMFGR